MEMLNMATAWGIPYAGSIVSKLGFNARANIMVRVDRDSREEARNFLINHQNVNSVYKISNGFDFLIEGIFKNVRDVEDFIDIGVRVVAVGVLGLVRGLVRQREHEWIDVRVIHNAVAVEVPERSGA